MIGMTGLGLTYQCSDWLLRFVFISLNSRTRFVEGLINQYTFSLLFISGVQLSVEISFLIIINLIPAALYPPRF